MVRSMMKGLGALLAVVVLGLLGGFLWARSAAAERLARVYTTHRVEFPIPVPLTDAELADLRAERAAAVPADGATDAAQPPPDPLAGVDLAALATERAVARGQHLVAALYPCTACHGQDFGGGVMVDDPALGTLRGPNLTMGEGSVTREFVASDWDRAVRHGVLHDGRPSMMPSVDFMGMSDEELSDVVAYIRSLPPVDAGVPLKSFGPVGTVLVATGQLTSLAETLPDHNAAHPARPPTAAPDAEFGRHLVQVCTGCHRADLSGGPIRSGDPSWPPAANLTPGPEGLQGWSYDDFVTALREAKSKNGVALRSPMSEFPAYAHHLTDTELRAMWAYISAAPPQPDGT